MNMIERVTVTVPPPSSPFVFGSPTGISTYLPHLHVPVRVHPRVLAYPCDLVEAGAVFGRKPLTSPCCHFADPSNPDLLHPDYALPPSAPAPDPAPAAVPAPAPGHRAKPGVLPASSPCILTPNSLRECFEADAPTMKRGGYVQYTDIPVCWIHRHVARPIMMQ